MSRYDIIDKETEEILASHDNFQRAVIEANRLWSFKSTSVDIRDNESGQVV
jgi:hypothetical protein